MHNAEYITCQENTSKRSVFRRIHETASVLGDGWDNSWLIWHTEIQPFRTEAEAKAFLQSASTAEKRDHAVRFIWHAKSPKAKQQTAVKWLIRYEWHN